jgi:hypothetical protein
MTEDKPKCNVDDILCQLGILSHLRGMQTNLGSEEFKSKFPEFAGWDETILKTIKIQEADLSEALKNCEPRGPDMNNPLGEHLGEEGPPGMPESEPAEISVKVHTVLEEAQE